MWESLALTSGGTREHKCQPSSLTTSPLDRACFLLWLFKPCSPGKCFLGPSPVCSPADLCGQQPGGTGETEHPECHRLPQRPEVPVLQGQPWLAPRPGTQGGTSQRDCEGRGGRAQSFLWRVKHPLTRSLRALWAPGPCLQPLLWVQAPDGAPWAPRGPASPPTSELWPRNRSALSPPPCAHPAPLSPASWAAWHAIPGNCALFLRPADTCPPPGLPWRPPRLLRGRSPAAGGGV